VSAREPALLLVALNEFSTDLFARGARELGLRHVERLLAMSHATTHTDDAVEHHGLDPWVQWVSVHTGQPSSAHGVLHLGDTPGKLGQGQLWEVLGGQGISSGIWGAMNATRGASTRCLFFLPDPWTFSEPAYPEGVNDLLALPRYYSRNYLDVSAKAFIAGCLRLARYVATSGAIGRLLRHLPFVLGGALRNGVDDRLLFSLFDLFSTELFVAKRRRQPVRFSLVFLNSIAHLQHHRWRVEDGLPGDVAFALRTIDRVLGILFAALRPGEALVVMNALTQRNVGPDEHLVAWRQVNPTAFLTAAGFSGHRVEQLMTSDGHVFLADATSRDAAVAALEAARVDGKPVFQAEADPGDPRKLFYQIILWEALPDDAELRVNGRRLRFADHFAVLAHRTGAHLPGGDVFSDGITLPPHLENHAMFDHILRHFEGA
jgi:hypothetical protein